MRINLSVAPEQVTRVNLLLHIADFIGQPIGHNNVRNCLEYLNILDDPGIEKAILLHGRLVDYHFNSLTLYTLHDSLNRRDPDVIRTALHDQAVDAHDLGIAANDGVRDEVLASGVGLDNGVNQVLRHAAVVGEQLFGILGQAVTPIAEGGIVVVQADTRI